MKELLKKAFNAGMAYATASHENFKETHPPFSLWYESVDVWQPIETAPSDTYIDIWSAHYRQRCVNCIKVDDVWLERLQFDPSSHQAEPSITGLKPTHWMPIPELPTK